MSANPDVQVQRSQRGGAGYGRFIVPGVIGLLILILILQNTKESWRFHFFFWWISLPAWLMLILWLIVGFAVGFVITAILRRRRRRERRRNG